jgi:WD40 repeat protein
VRVWDESNGAVVRRVEVGGGGPIFYHIALSKDRSTAAVTEYKMKDYIWDLKMGKRRAELEDGQYNMLAPVFTPDGEAVASRVPLGSGIRLWDAKSGKPTVWIAIDDNRLGSFAFSPDGKTIAVEHESGPPGGERIIEMSLWDVALNKEIRRWLLPNQTSHHLGFVPDGAMIAGAENNAVHLWDATTGNELPTLRGPEDRPALGWLNCLAFSQDGRTLAAAGDNGVICLWDVGARKVRAVFTGHRAKVTSLDFSLDGARLISGSADTTAIIWDLADLNKIITPGLPDPQRHHKE